MQLSICFKFLPVPHSRFIYRDGLHWCTGEGVNIHYVHLTNWAVGLLWLVRNIHLSLKWLRSYHKHSMEYNIWLAVPIHKYEKLTFTRVFSNVFSPMLTFQLQTVHNRNDFTCPNHGDLHRVNIEKPTVNKRVFQIFTIAREMVSGLIRYALKIIARRCCWLSATFMWKTKI